MTRLKIAVVGVGALGRHHARILSTLDSVELVGVAETDIENAQPFRIPCAARQKPQCRAHRHRHPVYLAQIA